MVATTEMAHVPGRKTEQRDMLRTAARIVSIVTSIGLSVGAPLFSTAWAQQLNSQSPDVVIAGKVTENTGTSLQINQLKVYPLHPHAKLTDEEGHVLELEAKDIEPGFNVKLHLTEGFIDHIVVLFPK